MARSTIADFAAPPDVILDAARPGVAPAGLAVYAASREQAKGQMKTARRRKPVILLLFANDRAGADGAYLRNLPEECRALRAALEPVTGQYEIIDRPNITRGELFGLLRRYSHRTVGVHFGGHADPQSLQIEAREGHPDGLSMEGFAGRLGEMKQLVWVFFNGCATRDLVAEVQRRAPVTAVATASAIRDDAAAEFATEFYENLAIGRTLAQSFDAARDRLLSHPGSGNARFLRPAAPSDVGGPPWLFVDPPGEASGRDFQLVTPATGGFDPIPARPTAKTGPSKPRRVASGRLALDRRKAGLQLVGHEITVELRRAGDEAEVHWHVGGARLEIGPLAYPARLLDRPAPDHLVDALFPPVEPPTLARILARLGDSTLPNDYSVRLRICTDDAAWASLPWRHTQTGHNRLVDGPLPWTIELTTTPAPNISVTLARTPRIIVLESDRLTAHGVRSAMEVVSHRYASRNGRPDDVVGVTPDGLNSALAGEGARPRAARRPFILVDAATPDVLDHVRRCVTASAEHPEAPAAICLIGAMPRPAPLDLLRRAAVVVALPDLRAAKQWLRRVVVEDIDPVVAAHPITDRGHVGAHDPAVAARARALTSDAAPADVIMTAYARWQPARVVWDEPPPPRIMLDRQTQQDRVDKRVDELLDPDSEQAAEIFIALARPGHKLELLGEQLVERVGQRPTLHLEVRRPRLPRLADYTPQPARDWLSAAVTNVIEPHLERDPKKIAAVLARGHLQGTRRIVWLDWGTVSAAEKLKGRELVDWLAWQLDLARAAKGAGIKVVAYLACEVSDPEKTRRFIEGEAADRFSVAAQVTPLDPLKTVSVTELQQYLRKRKWSRVPTEYVDRLTGALRRAVPDGDFEALVAHLEEGLRIGWHDLWRALSAAPRTTIDLDEDL